MSKLSSTCFRYLCGALMLAGGLSADESEDNTKPNNAAPQEGTIIPAGTRPLPLQEELAERTLRAKQELGLSDNDALPPEEEMKDEVVTNGAVYAPITTNPNAIHLLMFSDVFGEFLDLEDGSRFTISELDRFTVSSWNIINTPILVTPNHRWFSRFAYVLTNQMTGESVEANVLLVAANLNTRFVVGVDPVARMVWLNDGSTWLVHAWDRERMFKWGVNDTVIMGSNDGAFTQNASPNILINVNMNNYLRTRCIGY